MQSAHCSRINRHEKRQSVACTAIVARQQLSERARERKLQVLRGLLHYNNSGRAKVTARASAPDVKMKG